MQVISFEAVVARDETGELERRHAGSDAVCAIGLNVGV
jgi:hypothetical protein